VLLTLPCLASAAWGQTNVEVNAGIQFNFSTPGARSLAMGGAFLGLADDATAAYANPAGLTTLTRPEVSFEGRSWLYSHTFTDRGRLTGARTGRGVDTIEGLRDGEASNTVTGPSFLSFVYPKSRWRVALYRHELANFEARFRTQGAFLSDTTRLNPTTDTLDLKIIHLGLAFAGKINDNLSFGVGLSSYNFHLESRTDRFTVFRSSGTTDGLYGPPLYDKANLVDSQTQSGEDRAIGFNGGFHWKIRDGWTLGGAYRQGPKFDLKTTSQTLLAQDSDVTKKARFGTPDFLGLGLSIQPMETITLNLDIAHVRYSDLTNSFTAIVLKLGNLELTPVELRQFRADDVTEIHLGFEKAFRLLNKEVFARVGAWSDPDHRIRYEGEDLAFRALFRPGKDEIHYCAGFGLSGEKFEVDTAADLSNRVDTISLSTVFRF